MKINKLIFLFIFFILINNIKSNPIMPIFFYELQVDSNGWVLEMYPPFDIGYLNGWYLTSSTDTAFFKNNIFLSNDYLIITQDSLTNTLSINPMGDNFFLYDSNGFKMDSLIFGELPGSMIVNPQPFQSLSRYHYVYEYHIDDFYYLDNSPTIGFENDWENAVGNIEGFVTDKSGIPLDSVRVLYDIEFGYMIDSIFVYTDTSGYFIFSFLANKHYFQFDKTGYQSLDYLKQIYPDSTILLSVELKKNVQSINQQSNNIKKQFYLSTNYPNPFNNSTTFQYYLPWDTQVELLIYNLKGELVNRIFSEFQQKGQYKINWDFQNFSSGIYFYQLKTPEVRINKKCVLLK